MRVHPRLFVGCLVLVAAMVAGLFALPWQGGRAAADDGSKPAARKVVAVDAVVGIQKKVTGATMPLEPGTVFSYELTASCSSLTTSCVNASVEDVLPAGFDITSLPKTTDTRTVNYDPATRRLVITFTEPLPSPPAPAGSTGLPAGASRNLSIALRVPQETTFQDGAKITNTATIKADNADPAQASADVTVRIPREVRPITTKQWADGAAVAQSHAQSTITLGVRNASSTSAQVGTLTVEDAGPATFDNFDLVGVGPVDRFPAGADQVRALVCTKPVGSPCTDAEYLPGPLGLGPDVPLPPGVAPGQVTGVRLEFSNSTGAVLPYDPTGGTVRLRLVLRDTLRSTGEPLNPATRKTVANCATTTAQDPVAGAVTSPPACANFDILPNIATVAASKEFFSDTNGDFVADGAAVFGTRAPVTIIASATNTASFPVASLTITEPSATAVSEFDKVDVSKYRIDFPRGATGGTLTVTCRDGSTPTPVPLSRPPDRQVLPTTGCPNGGPPSRVSVTFVGTDAAGHGTIVPNATGALALHGTLNAKVDQSNAQNGVANCADAAASNPVDGSGDGASTACQALPLESPRTDIRQSKSADQNELPPGKPVTFTLDLANEGNGALVQPSITDPPDPTATGTIFDIAQLTSLSVRYRYPSGLPVVLEVYDPAASAWVPYNADDAALLARARGVRGRVDGELPSRGRLILDVTVLRRDGVPDGQAIHNCMQIASAGTPIGGPACTATDTTTAPARTGGSIQKSLAPSTVARPLPGVPRQEVDLRIRAENNGNINLKQLVVTDNDVNFSDATDLVRIAGVSFPPGANQVRVDACTTGCAGPTPTWINGTVTNSETPALPTGVNAADVRGLRFTFSSSRGGYDLTPGSNYPPDGVCPQATVCLKVTARETLRSNPATKVPDTLSDTAQAAGESTLQPPGGLFPFGDSTATLTLQEGTAQLAVTKTPDSRIGPGETAPFTITVRNTGTGVVPDPVVADPIPALLRFDESFAGPGGMPFRVTATGPGTTPTPVPLYQPQRDGTGLITKVIWRFTGFALLPGAELKITFQVRLAPGVPGDSVIQNIAGAGSDQRPDLDCAPGSAREGKAVDDVANFGKGTYCTSRAEVTTLPGTAFEASKWVTGDPSLGLYNSVTQTYVPLDSPTCPLFKSGGLTYTQYPCTALVQPGQRFEYLIRAVNTGTEPGRNIRLLDVFPYRGDTGVLLGNQQRGTQWVPRPTLTGAPQLVGPGTLSTRYSTVANPCGTTIETPSRACAPGNWQDGFTPDTTGVEMGVAFDPLLAPGGEILVRLPMASPVDLQEPGDPAIAWNSFAHSETVVRNGAPEELPVTEPPKVGIGMRFGNLRVDKAVTGLPEGLPPGPYTVAYQCTVTPAGGTPQKVREGTWQITPYTPMALVGVPAGATCRVWETDSAGAHSPHLGEANALTAVITPARPDEEGQHLVIANEYTKAGLRVEKTVTGAAAAEVGTGPFTIRVDCTLAGQRLAGFPKDLVFDGKGVQSIDQLPTGAQCTATEPVNGGATTVTVTATDSAGGPTGTAVVDSVPGKMAGLTVADDFPTGSLRVVKQIDGPGAAFADRTFRFRVACTFNGKPDAVVRTLALKAPDLTGQLDDLPAGSECIVTEVDPAGADQAPPPVGPVTVRPGPDQPDTVVVGFTNTFSTGSMTLHKEVAGAPSDAPYVRDAVFEFRVTCIREAEGTGGSPAVAFVVRKRYQLKAGESLRIPDLPIGARCWAEETATGGAGTVTVDHGSHADAVIVTKDAPDVTITAVNTFATGKLRLVKQVAGAGAGFAADRQYTLLLSCTLDTGDGRVLTLADRRPYTFTGAGERDVDLGFPLPTGARCWATETQNGGASTWAVDHHSPDTAVVVGTDRTVTITAVNTFDQGQLVVTKKVTGAATGKGPYTFTVDCVVRDLDGTELPIVLPAADARFTLGADQSRTIAVPSGARCTVDEVDRPADTDVTFVDTDPNLPPGVVQVGTQAAVTVTNSHREGPPPTTMPPTSPPPTSQPPTSPPPTTNPPTSQPPTSKPPTTPPPTTPPPTSQPPTTQPPTTNPPTTQPPTSPPPTSQPPTSPPPTTQPPTCPPTTQPPTTQPPTSESPTPNPPTCPLVPPTGPAESGQPTKSAKPTHPHPHPTPSTTPPAGGANPSGPGPKPLPGTGVGLSPVLLATFAVALTGIGFVLIRVGIRRRKQK
ncbi:DUF5979 domain-containing protein [Embleya sp. AB8]|uniref:DUF5979 domain-containing protein n=1 Tax=Embleya sp. AB8 TaxID=3156304 RepID=UPI003C7113B2